MMSARLLVAAALLAAGCSDQSPSPVTLVPTTRATVLEADTGSDRATGDTTVDEQPGSCSELGRAFYAAIGASGPLAEVRPLYDAVTPLLPEALRADWTTAADAFVAYEDAASAVPIGDDQLDDSDVRAAYDEATSDEVQAALQRVRDGIAAECPGAIDDLDVTAAPTTA